MSRGALAILAEGLLGETESPQIARERTRTFTGLLPRDFKSQSPSEHNQTRPNKSLQIIAQPILAVYTNVMQNIRKTPCVLAPDWQL